MLPVLTLITLMIVPVALGKDGFGEETPGHAGAVAEGIGKQGRVIAAGHDERPGRIAGDIMVAGDNFGCGSSREHAPIAIKAAGVSCVIAKTFARIFYRNAINIGLPIMECPEAAEAISAGDQVEVNYSTGTIHDITTGATFHAVPFPDFIREIIDAGGLLASINK